MVEDFCVTLLMDNTAALPEMRAEHGLSMYIETDGHRALFDTGQSAAFVHNAAQLGCALDTVEAIALSHGHYDHTGGLAAALSANQTAKIFLHPDALHPKYSRGEAGRVRSIGIPATSREALESARERIVWAPEATELIPGVWCTGEVPRSAPPGIDNSRFFLDEQCYQQDPLTDDQALFVRTREGVVVLAGCTHAGVVNTFDAIARLSGHEEFLVVIGGLHLNGAPLQAWETAAEALIHRKVQWIAPCHCTGAPAWEYLRSRLGAKVHQAGAGCRFTLTDIV
jgi:7,8-dihydropterin-6-yl-methyl-4-(beta-D-ribofuranosyl)aminobenzene 5'-phosphate synthase